MGWINWCLQEPSPEEDVAGGSGVKVLFRDICLLHPSLTLDFLSSVAFLLFLGWFLWALLARVSG